MEKHSLTIKINPNIYHQLKSDIGKGKMSDFIENLIVKELGSSEKKIEQEYREFYANPQNLKEAKQ
jgi:predicted CopG family antitoxin